MNEGLLVDALLRMSRGAAAVRYAVRASASVPGVRLSPDFAHNAFTVPLGRVAKLLGYEEPAPVVQAPPRARRRPRAKRTPKPTQVFVQPRLRALPEPPDLGDFEARASAWDPDDRPYNPASDPRNESSNSRALLLEIVRRAAYDWVLYRSSSKLQNRALAENAYHWLFVEDESSGTWTQRQRNGKEITAFVSICEMLDFDPDRVRDRIRTLTERDIMGAGRPAERRKHKTSSEDMMQTDDLRVFDVDVDSIPQYDPMYSSSEG